MRFSSYYNVTKFSMFIQLEFQFAPFSFKSCSSSFIHPSLSKLHNAFPTTIQNIPIINYHISLKSPAKIPTPHQHPTMCYFIPTPLLLLNSILSQLSSRSDKPHSYQPPFPNPHPAATSSTHSTFPPPPPSHNPTHTKPSHLPSPSLLSHLQDIPHC